MPDELLRPTIGAGVNLSVRPWRLMSQTYVAFFGGVIASTTVAWLNARRLGVDTTKQRLILGVGVLGLAAVTAAYLLIDSGAEITPVPNIAGTVIAVVCCLVQLRIQRPMDRAFQLRGTDYASLWRLGILATIGGAIAQALVIFLVDVVV